MAIWSNQDACARFQSVFKERTSHSTNISLHESCWDGFGIFGDIELRLLSERLQVLENTIGIVMENSALLTAFFPPRGPSMMCSGTRSWPKRMIRYRHPSKRIKGSTSITTDE